MALDATRATMAAFLEDLLDGRPVGRYLASDARFLDMETGVEQTGRDAVARALVALLPRAPASGLMVDGLIAEPNRAVAEILCGPAESAFACVLACDLAGGAITGIRVYRTAGSRALP